MPAKEKKDRKPRTPSKRQVIVAELKTELTKHKKKVSQIQKDLKSFGYGRKKPRKTPNA